MKPLGVLLLLFVGLGCGSTKSTPSGNGGGRAGDTGAGPVSSVGGAWQGTGGTPGTGGSLGSGGGTKGSGGATGGGGATGAATGGATGSTTSGGLPEGNRGIAARYPGDVGIAGDPAVIFADDFESYAKASDLDQRWDNKYQNQYITLTADDVYAGKQALELTLPQQGAELSDAVEKVVSPELDVLFLRYYGKFQPPYDVTGSSHDGSSISAHCTVNGQSTPGVPADGKNKFLANLENWRGDSSTPSPGQLNVYIYHPEQRSQWFRSERLARPRAPCPNVT